MKILLVEDEEAIRGFVRINLKRSGMVPIEAGSGEQALQIVAEQGPPDIALLDIMLPGISGLEVCAALRAAYPEMGIVMLTAKSQEQDKIQGLELGADDYIQKPFSPGELMARIRSLARRLRLSDSEQPGELFSRAAEGGSLSAGASAGLVPQTAVSDLAAIADSNELLPEFPEDSRKFGAFLLSEGDRKLWKNGDEIVLTPTEWTLVKLLLDRIGQSVSRDEILTEVWGRYYAGDLKVVDVNIRRIRQKVEDDPSNPSIIKTVWGFGYRWSRL
ncbi:response regulator transcription factor [Paenibacillus pasadenensis]|uniref:response regulator transcription factor n=1 Tax=Paenibacillus pasadenensis TaxID=217090 RepID=UPI002041B70A|nr:response regulator transcription factor [Paenibacillus pasadenensis]MCM3749296.1 response regulator transcription factor [Paenibacillus pasadenensis]